MGAQIRRLAIAASGEPALRVVQAVRELNLEGARIVTVALFTDGERRARPVREADEAKGLGPATWRDESGAPRSALTDLPRLSTALSAARVDAVWAGQRTIAQQAELAELCATLGIVFVGPSVETLRLLLDRTAYTRAAALGSAIPMEAVQPPVRSIEVPILGDYHGHVWALPALDGSVQRAGRKLIQASPPPALEAERAAELGAAAARFAKAVGYRHAGSLEFAYERSSGRFSLQQVHVGVHPGHPATERVTGIDLVKLQLQLAMGARLEGEAPRARGHAVVASIVALPPPGGFPRAGARVDTLQLPGGPGLRIDPGLSEGDKIAQDCAPVITRVAALGGSRSEALCRLRRALCDMVLLVDGGESDKGFLLRLLRSAELARGDVEVGWLERWSLAGGQQSHEDAEEAVVSAAIFEFAAEEERQQQRFYALAARGRPQLTREHGGRFALGYAGTPLHVCVRRTALQRYQVEVGGAVIDVEVVSATKGGGRLRCGERVWRALSTEHGGVVSVEVDGIPYHVRNDSGGLVRALAPSIVVSIHVEVGQLVKPGDRIALVEAMKTETTILSPFAGQVREILAIPNTQVDSGTPLVKLDVGAEGDAAGEGARSLDFSRLSRAIKVVDDLSKLRRLLLGFDGDPRELRRALSARGTLVSATAQEDPAVWAAECDIIDVFADVAALFRREPERSSAQRESDTEYLLLYLKDVEGRGEALPAAFTGKLRDALAHYGIFDFEPTKALRESLVRIFKGRSNLEALVVPMMAILQGWSDAHRALEPRADSALRARLTKLINATEGRYQSLNDLSREVRYRYFERPILQQVREQIYRQAEQLVMTTATASGSDRSAGVDWLVSCPQPLERFCMRHPGEASGGVRAVLNEVLLRRYYRIGQLQDVRLARHEGLQYGRALCTCEGERLFVFSTLVESADLALALSAAAAVARACPAELPFVADFHVAAAAPLARESDAESELSAKLSAVDFGRSVRRLAFVTTSFVGAGRGGTATGSTQYLTFKPCDGALDAGERAWPAFVRDPRYPGLHPTMAARLQLWRLQNFGVERLPSVEDVYLFRAVARDNPRDERLYALAEVRDLTAVRDGRGRISSLPNLENVLMEALSAMRVFQAARPARQRLHWNRVRLFVLPEFTFTRAEVSELAHRLAPATRGLGLEKVEVTGRMPLASGQIGDARIELSASGSQGLSLRFGPPPDRPLHPLSRYSQNVVRSREIGLVYPYELVRTVTPDEGVDSDFPPGKWVEYDLDGSAGLAPDGATDRLIPVQRAPGLNQANVVVGLMTHYTDKVPEGMTRVILLGDPSRSMGSLAERECRTINAALSLAAEMRVPLEWIAVSAGARIAMDTGTETMDWIALTLRRIIEFTEAGHPLHVIVAGINVGAQPYWNAEATMLMHTKGVLIQTAQGAMVLTGKRALDYSGGVSAEDNFGIGGYDHVMGPNGQAQYFARDLTEAYQLLLQVYEHAYVVPGERFPRRAPTSDPVERDICLSPHHSDGFATVGEVFSHLHNPARKRPFDIRRLMQATIDADRPPLERFRAMRDAETAVVWDAHIGGIPVCLIGLESRPTRRAGYVPADGPEHWTSGTLFPLSSKKVARAINATSGTRPLVVLANLSGFDGSPESMRSCQLEYGAEIGRAVVNFRGPIVFTVVSRYHGGAFVVFSSKLNEHMEVAALEGAKASVIGGAPAAAVVFAREVQKRTLADRRVVELQAALSQATGAERVRLQTRSEGLQALVQSEKLGEVAEEFDGVHSIKRAREVGSVHCILPAKRLRPYLVDALHRGMEGVLGADGPLSLRAVGPAAPAQTARGEG